MIKKNKCPICKNEKFRYVSYTEEIWGGIYTVEQHGYCDRCGYMIEQAYSEVITGFEPNIRKGYKDCFNQYHSKNIRKRKRMKRKYNIKRKNEDIYLSLI